MPRAVVTGAAGFLGSHLCRAMLDRGWEVVGVDNLLTGRAENVADLLGRAGFTFVDYDVTNYVTVEGRVDAVLHFASPASPRDYLEFPIMTLKVGSIGTLHTLGLAKAKGARYLLASTSEVYGDPLVSPQPEGYRGNVDPVGPRGVYDEAKRFGEALAMAYHHAHGLDVKIARIFNTYGPGLRPGDGRAIANFFEQALAGDPVTIYGNGLQTRSFCYIDDEVNGLLALLESEHSGPLNLGNPEEHTVLHLARLVVEACGSSSEIVFRPPAADDPRQRRPDIELARRVLGWQPTVNLREGLERTHEWFVRQPRSIMAGGSASR
jgi:dTDP-glucose 4,6-dehydratase